MLGTGEFAGRTQWLETRDDQPQAPTTCVHPSLQNTRRVTLNLKGIFPCLAGCAGHVGRAVKNRAMGAEGASLVERHVT